jgi:hypothetical protein
MHTMGDHGRAIIHYSGKPGFKDIGNYSFMQAVGNPMKGRKTNDKLEGWVYCDRFLRFLRTIGPKYAATLRSLRLPGQVLSHYSKASWFAMMMEAVTNYA